MTYMPAMPVENGCTCDARRSMTWAHAPGCAVMETLYSERFAVPAPEVPAARRGTWTPSGGSVPSAHAVQGPRGGAGPRREVA